LREFKSTSASQITTYRDCKRLWFYQSVMGLPTPQRASAALGEAVHTQLEKYLDDGTLPDESAAGKIAKAGLSLLPKPGVVYTEVSMSGRGKDRKELAPDDDSVPIPGGMPRLVVAGLPVNGFIDVLDISADKPVVLDHKTTSDLQWAKTKEDLVEDVQMVLYGSYALDVVASMGVEADVVEAGHIVYLTKGRPYAQRTTVHLTREHLASERKKIAETVEEMKETAKARTPDAVPGEASVCNKYGGCHFKDKCVALGMLNDVQFPSFIPRNNPVTPQTVTPKEAPVSTVDPLAALAALRAKKAAANPPVENAAVALDAPAPVTPPTPAPAPQAASNKTAATLAKYGIVATPAPAPTPADSIVPADVPDQTLPSFAKPASHAPVEAPVEEPAAEAPKTTRKPKNYAEKLGALNWTSQQIERMTAESMRAAIDGSLDGRGYSVKPDGSIHVPGEGALDTATIASTPMPFEDEADEKKYDAVFGKGAAEEYKASVAPATTTVPSESVHPSQQAPKGVPAPAPAPVPAPVPAPAPSLVIYIDCSPEKGRDREYVLLEDYIQPMLPAVVEAYNRSCRNESEKVDFYSLIPYARGPGFVASLIMKSPPTGIVVCNTRFPATNAILEVLIPMADVVVRGLR